MEGNSLDAKARQWASFCHLAAFAGFFIPFGNIVGPLVVWLIKREEIPFVAEQGKEAINFQISITIYGIISAFLIVIVIGFFLLAGLIIFSVVMTIIATLKTNNGEHFRYPITIRLIQ